MKSFLTLLALPMAFSEMIYSQESSITSTANDMRGPVMQFRVVKTDTDKNETFTCLRVEFALGITLDDKSKAMTNTTVMDSISNCSSLQLDLEGLVPAGKELFNTVTVSFDEEKSQNEGKDTEIIYMNQVTARAISIGNETVEGSWYFTRQGTANENQTATPAEVEMLDWSFKCYNGFSMSQTIDSSVGGEPQILSLNFHQFRMERYPEYSDKAAQLEDNSTWQRILSCDADISKVLPILIGCVLAAIILVTLIGYMIARRRSSYAYEEL